MEKPNSTVIGNAISAYFLFFVCLAFLWSKNPNMNHPFIRNHVKTAFSLQILFIIMQFIMSYPLGDNIMIVGYSINTLIQIFLSIVIFLGLFYGAYMASKGKTMTLGEMFHSGTGKSSEIIRATKTENIGEEIKTYLVLSHIPFIGYMIYPSHKNIPRIRDIIQVNFIVTLICIFLYILGFSSLANLLLLVYIIWSVFSAMNIFIRDEILALQLDKVPTVTQKYILQKSLLQYLRNMMSKKTFIPFRNILDSQTTTFHAREEKYRNMIQKYKVSPLPPIIYYIPLINLIGIFFLKTKENYHIRYGLIITFISIVIIYFYGIDHPMMLLLLFPITYGIGNLYKKEYIMPYFDDIIRGVIYIVYSITHIFKRGHTLRKTTITNTTKIGEAKKES